MPADIAAAGFVMIIVGIALIIFSGLTGQKSDTKIAVGGFIGPVPFGFGSDPQMTRIAIVLSVLALAVFILFTLRIVKI